MNKNRENVMLVAQALGDICQEVVFVGGSVTDMYVDTKVAPEIRPTDDVDCIVEITTRKNYYDLEERLRSKGFTNDQNENAPICRWLYQGLKVDIMPIDENVLGFSNRWYALGFTEAELYQITPHLSIKIFSLPFFIASKMEAFRNRGKNDYRTSTDFEDIIYVLDNHQNVVKAIKTAPLDVQTFIASECALYLLDKHIREGIQCALPYGSSDNKIHKIESIIKNIVQQEML